MAKAEMAAWQAREALPAVDASGSLGVGLEIEMVETANLADVIETLTARIVAIRDSL